MTFDAPHALLQLPQRQPLRLTDALGTRVRAVSGTLWITIDHDPRDRILEPGQSTLVDSSQPVLITALGSPASVSLCAAKPGAGLVQQARAWMGRWSPPSWLALGHNTAL